MGKRGASSHIEFILSFTIFISFTIFMVAFIKPTKDSQSQDNVLFDLETAFKENVSSKLIRFPIKLEGDCVVIDTSLFYSGGGVLVYDSGGVELDAEASGGSLMIDAGVPDVYTVHLSPSIISGGSVSCAPSGNYEIGFIESLDVVDKVGLDEFQVSYNNDYENLKGVLGFPISKDFAVRCDACGFNLTRPSPEDADIYGASFTSPVLYNNGTLVNKEFVFRVW